MNGSKNNATKLNEEILEAIIEDIKIETPDKQREIINMLEIDDGMELLLKSNEMLRNKNDNQIRILAEIIYEILSKRLNNMMKNKKLSCSKTEKEHIDNLFELLLENRRSEQESFKINVKKRTKKVNKRK